MGEFCVKCSGYEATIELMNKRHYDEVQEIRKELVRLQDEVDKLSFDLAFYQGNIINLSCNNK